MHGRIARSLVALLLAVAASPVAAQPKKPATPVAPTPVAPAPVTPTAPAATPPAPAPAPPVDQSTTPETAPTSEGTDVDALRQEYLKLRDELFASRARAATIASALYSTRVQIKLRFGSERFWGVSRAIIRLDGASVFDDTAGAINGDDAVRFDGWIAPGRHLVTVRLELVGKDDDRFTTATESTFVVQAVAGKDLEVAVRSADDGDVPYRWKKSERGGYRLSLDVDVKTTARAGAKPATTKPAAKPAAKPAPKTSAAATPARRTGEAPRAH